MKRKSGDAAPADDRLEHIFRSAGFTQKQATLYRLLLDAGEARVSALSRRSGMKPGNTYALLRDLKQRGVVTEFEKDGVVHFRPEHPEKLTNIVEGRAKDVDIARRLAGDLVPALITQWKAAIGRPVVRYFEGEEGVRKVFEDVYAPGKSEVIGCVGLEEPDSGMYEHIVKGLMPLRVRRKIFARALNNDNERSRELKKHDREHLREIFLADPRKYPLPAEIDIYKDTVAFLSFSGGDFVGLSLENKAFATTMRSIFTLLFDLLRASRGRSVEKPS